MNQTFSSIKVSPGTVTFRRLASSSSLARRSTSSEPQSSTQPGLTWSVSSGSGTINASTGLYQAPECSRIGHGEGLRRRSLGHGKRDDSGSADDEHNRDVFTGLLLEHRLPGEHHDHEHRSRPRSTAGRCSSISLATITQIWNATIASHTGNHYTLKNAGYNSTIAPGQSVSIGFLGSPGGAPAPPTNFVVNGSSSNNPPPPGNGVSAKVTFADVNDWGTGFTGSLTITNTGTSAINGWILAFDFVGTISSIWNATIVSHVGNHYVIQDAGYNASIAAGQSVTIGFNASPGKPASEPTNYVLNGVALG